MESISTHLIEILPKMSIKEFDDYILLKLIFENIFGTDQEVFSVYSNSQLEIKNPEIIFGY